MEKNIQIFFIINLLVTGCSHLLQPQVWVAFFKWIRNQGRVGIFAYSFSSLLFGAMLVAFHWHWDGVVPTMITLFGLAQVLKSLVAFTYPDFSLKNMGSAAAQNPNSYQLGGIVLITMALMTLFHVLKD
jgi:hypothetical protein